MRFINRVQSIVGSYGKRMIGWEEIAARALDRSTVVQQWNPPGRTTAAAEAAARGSKVIMSPANRAYLDMKYDASTPIGLTWAGLLERPRRVHVGADARGRRESGRLRCSASRRRSGRRRSTSMADAEYLAFPRLIGIAEIGWSPRRGRSWAEYRVRLGGAGAAAA